MKKRNIFMVIFCFIMILSGCESKKSVTANNIANKEKIKIVVSFNPIKKIVEAIGKDKIDIETIIPAGTEPHSFQPKIKDLKNLNEANIFIYNGLGMEKWVDSTLENVDNKNIVIEKISKGCNPIKNIDKKNKKEHGEYDPHIWLGIKEVEIESENVKDLLVKLDKKNKQFYEKNYEQLKNQLEQLYKEYKKKFDSISNKKFVTGHAAFGYLCRDFGLEQNSVQDVFADGEPSINKMTKLVDYCKKNKIKTVFVEEMVSPKVSKTLAKEVGAKVSKINTLVSKEDNKSYIDSMEENLKTIYESMK